MASTKTTGTWDVLRGFNYPPGDKRAEVGDSVSDIMEPTVVELLTRHDPPVIAAADDAAKAFAKKHLKVKG